MSHRTKESHHSRKLLIIDPDVDAMPQTTLQPPPSPDSVHKRRLPINTSSSSPPRLRSTIPITRTPPIKPTTTTPFDSSMALTILVLLAALFFMGFFSVYIRRFADDSSVDLSRRRRRRRSSSSSTSSVDPSRQQQQPGSGCAKGEGGLDPSAVRSLPLFSYGGDAEDPIDCPVCLAEFEPNDTVKAIPSCRHVFHPRCIDTWLSMHVSCPLCRTIRLFPAKDGCGGGDCGDGLGVAQEDVGPSPRELGGRSTAESDDTWIEEGRRVMMMPLGVRRTSSCSSMRVRVPSLQRADSF